MDYFVLRHYEGAMKKLILLSFFAVACAPKTSQNTFQPQNLTGVYGGQKAAIETFAKSVVAIIDTDRGGMCTGTLIAPDLVLTAAHCIHGDGTSSEIYFETMIEPYGSQTTRVLKAVRHEKFHRSHVMGNWNDIALILIDPKDVPADYKPMRVMTNPQVLTDESKVIGTGYGVKNPENESGSGVLRWVLLNVLDASYTGTEISIDQSFEKGVCFGDSGGPVIVRNKHGENLLVGVISRVLGFEFHKCAVHSVITRVDVHLPWIRKQAQRLRTTGQ